MDIDEGKFRVGEGAVKGGFDGCAWGDFAEIVEALVGLIVGAHG